VTDPDRAAVRFCTVEEERDYLRRSLEIVWRMAVRGVGPDTTPNQVLDTIAAFVEKRLADPRDKAKP
jgi:hypothetical protein